MGSKRTHANFRKDLKLFFLSPKNRQGVSLAVFFDFLFSDFDFSENLHESSLMNSKNFLNSY